jgi:hypothetical protein
MENTMNIQEFIDSKDLYTEFVSSYDFSKLDKFPAIAKEFSEKGIGDQVCESSPYRGQYDYESGQLTDQWNPEVKDSDEFDQAYDTLCQVANDYASFVMERYQESAN